ncbi:MAG: trigger factor [Candidatus Tectomicrobia bacterium]|nr:trigger factor [Candidatus Tectomicrobia bacterium]
MKVEVERTDTCERRLTIEMPAERVRKELNAIYGGLQKRVKVPGFRQGKVPRSILENHYRQSVEQEVLQKLIPEGLSEAMTQEKLEAIGEPQIDHVDLGKDRPFQFVATTQVLPEIELSDYSSWSFTRHVPRVTDEQLEQAMQQLRERHAELRTVSGRAVREQDFVIASYQGFFEGAEIPAIHGTNATLEVGAGQVLPEIEQGVVGMTEGEEKTIPIALPDDYRDAALAGKTIEIRLTAVEIKEKALPELDDEFARAYEDADSLDLLRERLRSDVENAIGQRADAEVRGDILKRLVDENAFDVPEILVHDQMRRAFLQGLRTMKGGQLDEADFNVDVASLDETFSTQAREVVRGQLILRHIGAQAGVTVSPEEVDAEIANLAARMAQNPEALKQTLQRNGSLSGIENGLRDDKVFEAILSEVEVSDTDEERPPATEGSEAPPSEA